LVGSAPAYGAVAGDDDRRAGVADELIGRVADLVVRARPAETPWLQHARRGLHARDVLGQFDMHGAGLLAARGAHGLADDLGDAVRVIHRLRPFGDRFIHADHVHDLMAFLVLARGRALAGQHQQRRMVHVGVGHAGDQVGRAGPQRAEADGGVAGDLAVGLGHEGRALFVAREDELDLR
jgi:hypothetical protein